MLAFLRCKWLSKKFLFVYEYPKFFISLNFFPEEIHPLISKLWKTAELNPFSLSAKNLVTKTFQIWYLKVSCSVRWYNIFKSWLMP